MEMIRVFVFVTGIALGQFSMHPGDPAIVLVARGQHAAVAGHKELLHSVDVVQGGNQQSVAGTSGPGIPRLSFEVGCNGKCPLIVGPTHLAALREVLGRGPGELKLRRECSEFKQLVPARGTTRCVGPNGEPLVNAHVTFSGPWNVASTIDCGSDYPDPARALSKLAFGPATATFTATSPEAQEFGNSMMFFVDVPSEKAGTVFRVDGEPVALDVTEKVNADLSCRQLGGPGSPTHCAVVAIRNRASGTVGSHVDGTLGLPSSRQDPADPHFAALYSLLAVGNNALSATEAAQRPIPHVVLDTCQGPESPTAVGNVGGCIGGSAGPP
jgi:hypothetical protein